MNGHYAMLSPLGIPLPDWKDATGGRLATPPVYVNLCVNETDESHQRVWQKQRPLASSNMYTNNDITRGQ